MSDPEQYIKDKTAILITDLEALEWSCNNEFIIDTKQATYPNEDMTVKIYVYKASDLAAIKDVGQSINEGEFETARKKIREYKKLNINLIEWTILEARIARMEILEE